MKSKQSFKDYFQIIVNFAMIFFLMINPIRTILVPSAEAVFIYTPSYTSFEAVNALQDQWFNETKKEIRSIYGQNVSEYSFSFTVTTTQIGLEWMSIQIEKKETHTMSSMTKTEVNHTIIHSERLESYPYETLKEEMTSLRLAQALHQKLHTQSDLIVNVKKLQRFIQKESTQLSLSSEGLIIQSNDCHESWCSSTLFEAVIDLGYIHDDSLVSFSLWLNPMNEGIFKSDPILDDELVMLALTFDDGPIKMTMKLVETLGKSNTKATFFLIGSGIEAQPGFTKEIHDLGHEIGNHTYSHPYLTELSFEEIAHEMNRTDGLIEKVIGVKPTIMRPPYGFINQESIKAFSHRVIQWSLDTVDWHHEDAKTIFEILQSAIDGDIILMHDRYEHTQIAVESFIQHQLSLGVQFVTVSKIIESRQFTSRIVHGVRIPSGIMD
jgi:peptidoglycan/xylan/chitin deacetylase (PgdA/CDA1 family)